MKLRWFKEKDGKFKLQQGRMLWFFGFPSFVYEWQDVPQFCERCDEE